MMMNFETVVRHYWPKALCDIKEDKKEREDDEKAIKAVTDRQLPTRRDDLRNWLWFYRVLQGFTTPEGFKIAEAVLGWADDDGNRSRDLTTAKALAATHAELMEVVWQAYGKKRDFTSLASKALWLCYPESVPMFDGWTRNALYVISKIENGINSIAEKTPEYEQFVHVWKQLYSKYKDDDRESGYRHLSLSRLSRSRLRQNPLADWPTLLSNELDLVQRSLRTLPYSDWWVAISANCLVPTAFFTSARGARTSPQ